MYAIYAYTLTPKTTPTDRQSYGSPMGRVWDTSLRPIEQNGEDVQTLLVAHLSGERWLQNVVIVGSENALFETTRAELVLSDLDRTPPLGFHFPIKTWFWLTSPVISPPCPSLLSILPCGTTLL